MTASSYDAERRPPEEREAELFARLPELISSALAKAPGLVRMLGNVDPASLTSREALAALPVLQKSELMELQASEPPFAGFVHPAELRGRRIFMSPGPIWEPEGQGPDPAQAARAFRAAGARPGDIVHNAFSYHMTPGAFMMDGGARALGCSVFPAGTGNVDTQIEAAQALRPRIYAGTPDFLKIILDRAAELHSPLTSFEIGLVSGGALFLSLREEYFSRGIRVYQCYATAEFGVIAYESAAEDGSPHPGMIVNENLIVEIVRPGTGDPVAEGEVGELVVTSLDPIYPLLRVSTGDLSAVLPGSSPCGRTGMRIRGWMGRADQRTKVKGMFVDPKQVALVLARHPQLQRARLVVSRDGARDVMTLQAEAENGHALDVEAITATLRDVTKLGATVQIVAKGSLPNDGKVIADERDYSA
ncbi:phenylacetate--CoA ligase family protein [Aquamicrobium zhengzhouense]|uniref:AMP-binding protein n=1 Tax=Aquamicrobium zhengzhouense TaxID=2781738 RepID=A0ABS0SAH7_9HYPH|nr:AMP-binding protein [Aquamicrobium zhengzhouense]MBI1619706.1 AMP-binding protein [Aquamicrobium zhengzhouense]